MDIAVYIAAVGCILGVFIGVPFGKVFPYHKELKTRLCFILISFMCFIGGISIPTTIGAIWNRNFVREFTLNRDIDLVEDHFFNESYEKNKREPEVLGVLKEGSVCKQTFRKGSAVYGQISFVIHKDDVNYK